MKQSCPNMNGGALEPITLIVAALMAGAAAGFKDTASAAVNDSYVGLKALVTSRIGGGPDAEMLLSENEVAPETWRAPLTAKLAAAGADRDRDLIAAAQALLDLIGQAADRYTVDVRGAQGVQVGDHNKQENVFNPPTGR